jgi:poly [ADP-ribose] polymerase 7/11/12/13
LAAEFVQDVNIPDGSVVVPGAVVKQWRLKNTGATKWPEGSKIIFLRGAREILAEREEFEVPLAEPGQVVEVAAPITIPEKAGRYSAYFQLADKDRTVFGHRFWVEFVVKEEEKRIQPAPSAPVKEPQAPAKEPQVEVKEKVVEVKEKVVQGLNSTIPTPAPSKYASSLGVLEKMGFVNEKFVFHGSRANAYDIILKEGFDHRVAHMGGAFGAGIYFAESSQTSSGYVAAASHRKMLFCRVLVGDIGPGKSGLRRPPEKKSFFGKTVLYDSVGTDGSVYVVFDNHQCYPEYVIHY